MAGLMKRLFGTVEKPTPSTTVIASSKTRRNNRLIRIVVILAVYLGLNYSGGEWGRALLYPIRIFVTFLHELGHALGTVFTGGSVEDLQINEDGSGFTRSINGSYAVILMGGYIGSAIMGNLLFYIGARGQKLSQFMLLVVAAFMVVAATFWYNSVFTTVVLFLFAAALVLVALKTKFDGEVAMFFGIASVIFIIQDFNVGPTSDLAGYAEHIGIFHETVWMYIWLLIVLVLTFLNIRMIWKLDKRDT